MSSFGNKNGIYESIGDFWDAVRKSSIEYSINGQNEMSKKKRKTDEQMLLKCEYLEICRNYCHNCKVCGHNPKNGIRTKDPEWANKIKSKKCENWQNCVNHMYCYVCKRNLLLTFDPDWNPEDFYQPKFATGGVVWGKAFLCEPELIISVNPAYGEDCSATVKAERREGEWSIVDITFNDKNETMGKDKQQTDRPDPLKDGLGYWDLVFGTGRFQKIKVPTPEEFKRQADRLNRLREMINPKNSGWAYEMYKQYKKETMKTENIWISDTMPDSVSVNGKKFKLVPVEEELTIRDCMDPVTTFDKRGSIVPATYRDSMINYPTKAIAEKVLLYGLLQSVAHKLNGGKHVENGYCISMFGGEFTFTTQHFHSGNVIFETRKLAEQAISIFDKSKFDLKKLYQ
jgi:hypothetical protein